HLVSVLGINSQTHRQVHRLVELGEFHFLQKRHRVLKRVRASFNGPACLLDVLPGFPHCTPRLPPPSPVSGWPWLFTTAVWRPQNLSYAVTSMPIERAVPFTLLTAASTEAAFRSGIFCLAISRTCFSVAVASLTLLGVPEPFATPAARFSRIAAGGVLVMKVNVRSLYTETTTGMISPSNSLALVFALNCLQNSMMLICACPSAGPTGGAGVALPAAICNFTEPVAFFAMSALLKASASARR